MLSVVNQSTFISFGEKLRTLRLDKQYTQAELAESLKIDASYLSKLEKDKAIPSVEVFDRIAAVFKLNRTELLVGLDPLIIRKYFKHIAIENYGAFDLKKNQTHKKKQYLLLLVALMFSGVLCIAIGQFNIFFPETAYVYFSDNRDNALNIYGGNGDGTFFVSYENLGIKTEKFQDGETRKFELLETKQVKRTVNHWLVWVGVQLFSLGGLLISAMSFHNSHVSRRASF